MHAPDNVLLCRKKKNFGKNSGLPSRFVQNFQMSKENILLIILLLLKAGAFFAVDHGYDFHRDELLYLALGGHPDWGYWSNPPMIGWFAALSRLFSPEAVEMVRISSLLASMGTMWLAVRMAGMMGGGFFATSITGLAMLICPPYLRTMVMFQPVVFDIFFWTLGSYCLLAYLKTKENRWLLSFGATIGLGLLNKYLLFLYVAALLAGMLLTPERQLFRRKTLYYAAGLALLIWLPNLIWQITHHFPVFHHMHELSEEQLTNVSPAGFIIGQLLSHLPFLVLILLGVVFFFVKPGKPFRLLGWMVVFTELLLLVLHGKDYYAFGLMPMVLAAGAVLLEYLTAGRLAGVIVRAGLLGFAFLTGLYLSPFSVPFLPVEQMVVFCENVKQTTGLTKPMDWEDGKTHALPQDYADMQGWREIAGMVSSAWQQSDDKEHTLIYAENYGQAGAIDWYGRQLGLPPVLSFSDAYLLWAPDKLDREVSTFIYVNDEMGEDVQAIFADITLVGELKMPYAREIGTRVYLCKAPRVSFRDFYAARIGGIKASLRETE